MTVTLSLQPNAAVSIQKQVTAGKVTWGSTLGILASRLVLFGLFQALVALICLLLGQDLPWNALRAWNALGAWNALRAWNASVPWWPVATILTNCVLMAVLAVLYRREGSNWRAPMRFERKTLARDLLVVVGFGIVMFPLAMMPASLLADALFGGLDRAYGMFFHALPAWAAVLSLVGFPITIALSELPTYCGYVQPRLEGLTGSRWLAWLLAAMFLAAQHMAMPLIFDLRFMLWRFLMFLPFALAITLLLRWRPRLLPYMMIFHGLLDLGTIWFVFAMSMGI